MTLEEFDDAYEHTNETPIKRARLSEDEHGYDQGGSAQLTIAPLQPGEHLKTTNERYL